MRPPAEPTIPKETLMSADAVLKRIKDENIKFVDLRFTDPKGKWQHVTFDVSMVDQDFFTDGSMFDGSSISGWKAINESDMILMPDPSTAVIDPCLLYTSPSPRDRTRSRMPSSA